MCIDIIIADPHPIMREALTNFLGSYSDFIIKSCVGNGNDALAALETHKSQILVMDLSLTNCSSIDILRSIAQNNLAVRTVLFTNGEVNEILRSLDLGVCGVVSRDKSKFELAECIISVAKGEQFLDRELTQKAMAVLLGRGKNSKNNINLLTPKEMLVAKAVIEGLPNKKIASKLFIQEGTVKLHLHKIYQKLNCPGRMSLQRRLQEFGIT